MTPSKDWIYCPKCRQEICVTKCWSKMEKKTNWECTNTLTGGYLDDYEYEQVIYTYHILYCPNDENELRKTCIDKHYTGVKQYN